MSIGTCTSMGEDKDPHSGCDRQSTTTEIQRPAVIEEVESVPYLGTEVGQTTKVYRKTVRLKKAGTVSQMWRWKVFRSCNLSNTTKLRVLCTLVMPILLYSAETWPVTQQDIRKLRTFHMRCLWDILGVTLWDIRRNADILRENG